MRKLTYEEILKKKPSKASVRRKERSKIFAVLDNIRSLHNVGAIFRTSDAVLLEKLYLCGITPPPPRKEISKTALGAEELVPFEYADEATSAVVKLKNEGVQIVAIELTNKSIPFWQADYKFPVCFVFGHEVTGISDELISLTDMAVEVPMLGRANSLNVATCYGIIMYDALRKLKNA